MATTKPINSKAGQRFQVHILTFLLLISGHLPQGLINKQVTHFSPFFHVFLNAFCVCFVSFLDEPGKMIFTTFEDKSYLIKYVIMVYLMKQHSIIVTVPLSQTAFHIQQVQGVVSVTG